MALSRESKPFNMEISEKGEIGFIKLKGAIEQLAALEQDRRIPLTKEGRISIDAYRDVYPDVARDEEFVGEFKKEHGKNKDGVGEKLEMLLYAILAKKLRSRFIVARTSEYDDFKGHADAVFFDYKGHALCALDAVGDARGSRYEEKKEKILKDRNIAEEGAFLKYGLSAEKNGEKTDITLAGKEHVPILYFALPKDRILDGIEHFDSSLDKQSNYEKKLFEYFVLTIEQQVKFLLLYKSALLHPQLRENLKNFELQIAQLKSAIAGK